MQGMCQRIKFHFPNESDKPPAQSLHSQKLARTNCTVALPMTIASPAGKSPGRLRLDYPAKLIKLPP